MKIIKIFILLFLSVIFLSGCGNNKKDDVLQTIIDRNLLLVGVRHDSKPFGYFNKETNRYEGIDIEIAKRIALELYNDDSKIRFIPLNADARIEAITSGQVDLVIATMSITPQRQYFVEFSDPYYIAGQAILVPERSRIKSIQDLNGKKIIVLLGTTAEKNIKNFIPSAILLGYKTHEDAFQAFLEGKADAISDDDAVLSGFVADYSGYRFLPARLTQEAYAIAFKKSVNSNSLKTFLNSQIHRMKDDGSLNFFGNENRIKRHFSRKNKTKKDKILKKKKVFDYLYRTNYIDDDEIKENQVTVDISEILKKVKVNDVSNNSKVNKKIAEFDEKNDVEIIEDISNDIKAINENLSDKTGESDENNTTSEEKTDKTGMSEKLNKESTVSEIKKETRSVNIPK